MRFCSFQVQWKQNGGKCGACGDPWNSRRNHEFGGKYFTARVSRTFQKNYTITVSALTSENLFGWFEFRILPISITSDNIHTYNLDKYLLNIANLKTQKYRVFTSGYHVVPLQLPETLVCKICVFQWTFHAGMQRIYEPVKVQYMYCIEISD